MKPNSYREQKCCGTCRFVSEDFWGKLYYCRIDRTKPPKNGRSISSEELRRNYKQISATWNRWAKPRKVEFHGVCDEWKEK
jgi:hypothetical protein